MENIFNNSITSLEEKIKFFSVPASIPLEKRDEMLGYFADVLTNSEAVGLVQQALHKYFADSQFDNKLIKEYYFTYWRWYVESTFARFIALSQEDCVLVFAPLFPSAYQLGIRVEEEIFYYFFRKFSDEDKLRVFYQKLKKNILESRVMVHPFADKPLSLFEIIPQYSKMKANNADSLVMADYAASMQRTLFPSKQEYEVFEESKKTSITKAFLEFLYFIFQDKDIVPAVNDYIDSIISQPNNTGDVLPPDTLLQETIVSAPSALVQPVAPEIEIPQTEPVREEIIPEPNTEVEEEPQLTLVEIKSNIDTKFEKDETGQYKNIEGVFELLEQLAEAYEDPEIAQLLYFDETSGGFVWKEE